MSARHDAVQRFSGYCQEYFKWTVYSSKCHSWYKRGKEEGRVTALWPGEYVGLFFGAYRLALPGSSLHAVKVFSNPCWEDFDYEYLHDNPLGWFGDG